MASGDVVMTTGAVESTSEDISWEDVGSSVNVDID